MLGNENSMLILMLRTKVLGNESSTYGTVLGYKSSSYRSDHITGCKRLWLFSWCISEM